jgi:hypothetical protein
MRIGGRYSAVVAVVLSVRVAHAQIADDRAGTLYPSPPRSQSDIIGQIGTAAAPRRTIPAQEAFYQIRSRTVQPQATREDGGLPHGLIGAVSGAIVGGGLGYFRMAMYCDNGVDCNLARPILIGAAAGAIVGVVIEYFVRNGQR